MVKHWLGLQSHLRVWHRKIFFQDHSHGWWQEASSPHWLLARNSSSPASRPLHRATHNMAACFPRSKWFRSERQREKLRRKLKYFSNLILAVTCHPCYRIVFMLLNSPGMVWARTTQGMDTRGQGSLGPFSRLLTTAIPVWKILCVPFRSPLNVYLIIFHLYWSMGWKLEKAWSTLAFHCTPVKSCQWLSIQVLPCTWLWADTTWTADMNS